MMTCRMLVGLAVFAALAGPAAAQDTDAIREDARALIGLAEQGRTAIATLEDALERLRGRIAELEAELAREPAGGGALSREAARDEIERLRAQAQALAREVALRGPTLADVLPRAQDAAAQTLADFERVEPDREVIAGLLGRPVSPSPGRACDLSTATASQLVICRTQELADLDRRLSSLVEQTKRSGTAVQGRLIDQEQRDFYTRLSSCAKDFSALVSEEGVADARNCISRRYAARIAGVERDLSPAATAESPSPTQLSAPSISADARFVTTRSNVRAGPTTSSNIVGRLEPCAEVRATGSNASDEWTRIAGFGGAWIASFLLSDRIPNECLRSVRGTVQDVIDPGTFVIDGREVRLYGIVPSGDDYSRRGMAEILDLYGNQVSCRHRANGRFICETMRRGDLNALDVALIAIFNGGACPGPDSLPEYHDARRNAVNRGETLRCP